MGTGRRRRVGLIDRKIAVKQVQEAQSGGCRIELACEAIGINKRTFERWRNDPGGDKRRGPITEPANKLRF